MSEDGLLGPLPNQGSSDLIRIEHLQRLELKTGDKYVLTVSQPLSPDMVARFRLDWERFAGPDVPLLILTDDIKLGVINTADG